MVCNDVEIEPALQNVNGENLNPGANASAGARLYGKRVTEIEQGTFTPLIFTTTGETVGKECLTYHSRLVELIANKKGEVYSKTMAWIRAKISCSILRSAYYALEVQGQ